MKTVLAHGVFDVLHIGHLAYLKEAAALGDQLIVSVTADKYVNKGPGRPHFNQTQRMQMIEALTMVTRVVLSDHPSAVPIIQELKPHVYVKGPDYVNKSSDPTGMICLEEHAVKSYGGQFVCTQTEMHSSSTLINRYLMPWTDDQRVIIAAVNELGGMKRNQRYLDAVQPLRVCVLCETIQDTYKFVRPQGISSKSASLSVEARSEESYRGGSWAIAAHVRGFCDNVTHPESGVTHIKTRYISEDTGQRLFEECVHPPEKPLSPVPANSDVYIAADFGHGLFDIPANISKSSIESFLALNVQTNSSNYGFNTYRDWSPPDYMVMDKRELQVAHGNRDASVEHLAFRTFADTGCQLAVTLGPHGSLCVTKEGEPYRCPAFADNIIDTIGAGDAFFALTSLLVKVDANPLITHFLGNVFAGLKTKIIGNKTAVSKSALLKACESILK